MAENPNPKVKTVQVKRPAAADASFVPALLKGMKVTLRHFRKNLVLPGQKRTKEGYEKGKHMVETVQYPEEKIEYPARNRGLHRLMTRDDGTARCVACMCCPTVCPANCITIIPQETTDPNVEKAPAVFEIDELRCVVCGLCVEVCPCDAIRMDTGKHAMSVETRGEGVMTKDMLMALGEQGVATQGGKGADWRDQQGDVAFQPRKKEM